MSDARAFNRLMYVTVANVCINRPLKTIYSLFYRFSVEFFPLDAMRSLFAFFRDAFSSLIVFIFRLLVPQQSMWRCNNNSRLLLSLKFKNACDILLQTALLRTI